MQAYTEIHGLEELKPADFDELVRTGRLSCVCCSQKIPFHFLACQKHKSLTPSGKHKCANPKCPFDEQVSGNFRFCQTCYLLINKQLFKPCENCGKPSLFFNRYCRNCFLDAKKQPLKICPICQKNGRTNIEPGKRFCQVCLKREDLGIFYHLKYLLLADSLDLAEDEQTSSQDQQKFDQNEEEEFSKGLI